MQYLSKRTARQSWILACAVAAAVGSVSVPSVVAADGFARQRETLRKKRLSLRKQVAEIRVSRAKNDARAIEELLAKAATFKAPAAKHDLQQLVLGLALIDADVAKALRAKVDELAPVENASPGATNRWQISLRSTQRQLIKRPLSLLNKTINIGATDLSYDFFLEILAYDPDASVIRRGLKQTKIDGQWRSPYVASRMRAGQKWDSKLGWVIAREADRYAAGEVYDYPSKKWMTLEKANQLHASLKNPWVVRTENIEMRGTARLSTLVEASEKLEAIYAQIFAVYAKFFMAGGKGNAARDFQVVFAQLEHKPLIVNIYKDKADYKIALPKSPDWSAGMYSGDQSHFFGNKVGRTMYHEFCHHVLAFFSRGGRSPAWLSEGIAVYTENVRYDKNGRLQIGGMRHRGGNDPLQTLLQLKTFRQWVATPKYSAAGKLVWFCMEIEDRKYRDDFIDFLRDSYRGRTGGKSLWEYLGVSESDFSSEYKKFLAGSG